METSTGFDGEPPFCAAGCGFYGAREHRGLCSKCHAAFLSDQAAKSAAEAAEGRPSSSASGAAVPSDDLAAALGEPSLDAPTPTMTRKRNRCAACDKRVGLLGFECRCGDVFCGAHRYPEEHGCDVDFRTAAMRRLAEENPLCKADKMEFRI